MLKNTSGLAIMWLGIIGAAITLFAGLLAPLDMTDWAWWLVQNWQDATSLVWDRLAAWLGAEVPGTTGAAAHHVCVHVDSRRSASACASGGTKLQTVVSYPSSAAECEPWSPAG